MQVRINGIKKHGACFSEEGIKELCELVGEVSPASVKLVDDSDTYMHHKFKFATVFFETGYDAIQAIQVLSGLRFGGVDRIWVALPRTALVTTREDFTDERGLTKLVHDPRPMHEKKKDAYFFDPDMQLCSPIKLHHLNNLKSLIDPSERNQNIKIVERGNAYLNRHQGTEGLNQELLDLN